MRLPWRLAGREGCEELHPSGTSSSPAYGRRLSFVVTLPFWVLKTGFHSLFPTNSSPEERQGQRDGKRMQRIPKEEKGYGWRVSQTAPAVTPCCSPLASPIPTSCSPQIPWESGHRRSQEKPEGQSCSLWKPTDHKPPERGQRTFRFQGGSAGGKGPARLWRWLREFWFLRAGTGSPAADC